MRSWLTGNHVTGFALGLCLSAAATAIQPARADSASGATSQAPATQAPAAQAPAPQTPAATSDQTAPKDTTIRLIADEAGYDKDLGVYVARGHVQVSKAGKTAMADTIAYNERINRIIASGHVSN